MATVHKVTFYIVDANDEYNENDISCILDNKFNSSLVDVESSEEFEWDDDLEINMCNCKKEEFDKYLK